MHLVYGLGKSGIAAARLLGSRDKKYGVFQDDLDLLSAEEKNAKLHGLGIDPQLFTRPDENWDAISCIVVSPGISPANKWVMRAKEASVQVITEVELGLSFLPDIPWIGVTGTNGKSSVVSYIEQIAKKHGLRVPACGNFGLPVCEIALAEQNTPDGLAIELSSYQLHYLQNAYTLKGAALTSFAADHLEWHGSLEAYKQAKAKIKDVCISSQAPLFVTKQTAQHVFGKTELNPLVRIYEKQMSIQDINLQLAKDLVYTLSGTQSSASESDLVPPAYRWQPSLDDARVINDSKSTNMHSLVFGVQKLFANTNNGDTAYLLIGGRGKNDGYKQALSSICKLAAEKSVYIQWLCFGESASELYNALPDSDHSVKTKHATMRQAVEKAFENRAQREFVLLSPGCASFDEFANFEERGKMFEKIVREMRK